MRASTLLLRCLVLSVAAACALAKEEVLEFKVVPGNPGRVTVALDTPPMPSSSCTFEWASTGATPEMWTARVSGDPRTGDLECEISRRGRAETYLLFEKFKTTLGTNEIVDALVHDNDGELSEEHWEADGECVENKHDWTGGTIRSIKLKSMVIG